MKKNKSIFIIIIILIIYFLAGNKLHLYLFCPINKLFHINCPGCGVTRMIVSIFKLDFAKAFRYNQVLFILFPFGLFLLIDNIYSNFKNKSPLYKKVPEWVWITIIIILIIFGILRNVIPSLAIPS